MDNMNPLQALITQLAADGISAGDLSKAVMQAFPDLCNAQYQSTLFGLQEVDSLMGQEVRGEWCFTAIDKTDPAYPHPEYSAEFAEKILAASCGEFVEISADDLIAQLDEMLAKARAKSPNAGS
ncbi:MAG: hypothetical protein KKC24_08505 [Gammaproteobacteria bacterium]|nr:hypothetical protein [Gammaproteobacteria bacterium]MBU0818877.1 hypothetical protein [Gammaproteobacteria bacterium]MBU0844281.1 hypothetical protein [Gammaproteobacteria bacterium]MBU1843564.1 hypothetical protein [Gammaproteobacteria bacterium]